MRARYRGKTDVVKQTLSRFVGDEGGATVIEYGLIAGFVTFAIIIFLTSMGDSLDTAFSGVNSDLETAVDSMQR